MLSVLLGRLLGLEWAAVALQDGVPQPQQRGMRLFWIDGLITSAGDSFYATFLTLYALAFGATAVQIGLMTSAGGLVGALALLPGAYLCRRWGRAKPLVLLFYKGGSYAAIFGLVFVPYLLAGQAAVAAIVVLYVLLYLCSYLGVRGWIAIAGALVPDGVRGRFFASRSLVQSLAAFLMVPLAGRIVEWGGFPRGYQLDFFVCALLGSSAILVFRHIPEQSQPPQPRMPWADLGQAFRGQPAFRFFCLVSVGWTLSLAVADPFFGVYMVRELHFDAGTIAVLASVLTLGGLIGYRVVGRLHDRRGEAWVLLMAGLLIPLARFAWLFVSTAYQVVPVYIYSGFVLAGYNIVLLSMLLLLTTEETRASYSGAHRTLVAVASFVGPLLGAALYERLGFDANLIASGCGLLASTALFWAGVVRPQRAAALTPASRQDRSA
jgi:MFS family permease